MQSIVQHALKKKMCKTTYSPLQISDLKALSKEISDAKHKVKMAERYQTKKRKSFRVRMISRIYALYLGI